VDALAEALDALSHCYHLLCDLPAAVVRAAAGIVKPTVNEGDSPRMQVGQTSGNHVPTAAANVESRAFGSGVRDDMVQYRQDRLRKALGAAAVAAAQ